MDEEHEGVESSQGNRASRRSAPSRNGANAHSDRNPRGLLSSETAEVPRSVGEHNALNGCSRSAQPARRRSLSSLWGSAKPQQRSVVLAAGFPRQTDALLGCAVLSASAAVRSGRDSPPLSDMHFPGSSFGGLLNVGGFSAYGESAGFRVPGQFGFPRSLGSHHGLFARPRPGLESLEERGAAVAGTPRGADHLDSFRPRGGTTRHEEEEAAEGWGAKGWSGDSIGVKKTSFDAASSKLSASLLGYFPDEFLKHFVTQPTRMQPLINRGYYSRVEAIRRLIVFFLEDAERLAREKRSPAGVTNLPETTETHPQQHLDEEGAGQSLESCAFSEQCPVAQIVNVGAGADTTAFFLARWGGAIVFDVDFPDVCREKATVIQGTPELRACLGEAHEGPAAHDPCIIRTSNYRLVAVDIRNTDALKVAMQTAGLKENLPTLFLCECVLIYLRVEEANAVVQWASRAVPMAPSCLIIYEQFNPNDPFGRMMARNLQIRNCPLLTFTKYPTLESQRIRFAELGWPECSLADMQCVYKEFLPKSERDRVQALEIFDELEEWWLIQSHYFLGVLVRPASPQAGSSTLTSLIGALDIKAADATV